MLITTDGTGKLVSSSTPTAANYLATSTTATSTFAGGLSVAGTAGLTVLQNGNVGIGDDSPLSLLTVGNGDLFQINSSGQVGVLTAPVSDYLMTLNDSVNNSSSRIIDITQADSTNENSYGIYSTNTVNLGTLSSGVSRTLAGMYQNLTPTANLNFSSGITANVTVSGVNNNINLSNISFADSNKSTSVVTYGDYSAISGSPTVTDINSIQSNSLSVSGTYNTVGVTPTWSGSLNDDMTFTSHGGYFENTSSSAGDALLTSRAYGVYGVSTGNLTTTGDTIHYGGYFQAGGTADTNYGLYVDSSDATTNYGIYSAATGQSYFAGNVGIGTTSPYAKLSVVGQTVAAYFTATTTATSTFPTLLTTNATSSSFAITNLTSTLLKTNSFGSVIPAVAGTDYALGNVAYPFTPSVAWGALAQATTSLLAFPQGLIASGTIGRLTVGSLTATSTVSFPASSITNTMLLNSTISGVALGGTLFALTNNDTLGGSSYDGSSAISDWGINLGNANTWTAAQLFNYTATTSFSGGLYASLISSPYFHATSTTATSTFSGGISGAHASLSAGLIVSGGNVGIGTSTPQNKLNVVGDLNVVTSGSALPTLYANTSGNVGIGTAAPDSGSRLHVVGPSFGQLRVETANSGINGPGILIMNSAASGAKNWVVGANQNASNLFEITPSTANDGTTFSTPNLSIAGATGNVGIGTTSPVSKLSVSGGASVGADYNIAAPTNGMIIQGNVGIGTTSPVSKLSVLGESAFAGGASVGIGYAGTAAPTGGLIIQGNVGIGTTGPSRSLHIAQSESIAYLNTTSTSPGFHSMLILEAQGSANNYSQVRYMNQGTSYFSAGIDPQNSFAYSIANGSNVNVNPRLTITTGGNVGIGTTSPTARLEVGDGDGLELLYINGGNSGSAMGVGIYLNNAGTPRNAIGNYSAIVGGTFSSDLMFYNEGSTNNKIHFHNNGGVKMVIDSSGNVGIGTTSPLYKLSVESTSEGNMFQIYDTDGNCLLDPDSGGITTTCSSDIRLKTNITDAQPVLSYLANIPIKDYTVIASGDQRTGVVAQELLASGYSDLVHMGPDGYYGVSEISSWKLIKGIQELDLRSADIARALASTTSILSSSIADIDAKLAQVLASTFASSTIDQIIASTTVNIVAGQSFIARIAEAVKNLIASAGEWAVSKITSALGVFERVNVGTAAVQNGLEMKDSATGETYCVTIKNGEWNKATGTCDSPTATTGGPIVTIQGNNPASIEVGTSYVDLGVIAQDSNGIDLSIRYFVNGAQVSAISLDTSTSTTYTIDYSATDNAGLTATSTRIVNVENQPLQPLQPLTANNQPPEETATTTSPVIPPAEPPAPIPESATSTPPVVSPIEPPIAETPTDTATTTLDVGTSTSETDTASAEVTSGTGTTE